MEWVFIFSVFGFMIGAGCGASMEQKRHRNYCDCNACIAWRWDLKEKARQKTEKARRRSQGQ